MYIKIIMRGVVSALALLTGSRWLFDSENQQLQTVHVNSDAALLKEWESEKWDSDAAPECEWYEHDVQFSPDLCSHFSISRSRSYQQVAFARALACSGAFGSPCVLNAEIGLAVPTAYVLGEKDLVMVAPKLLSFESEQVHVRVSPPDGDGLFGTKRYLFNATVSVEFLDGLDNSLRHETLSGEAAFCMQLLRSSYTDECWTRLD